MDDKHSTKVLQVIDARFVKQEFPFSIDTSAFATFTSGNPTGILPKLLHKTARSLQDSPH